MDLHDVVMKLVGPVRAVGETRADDLRLANLKVLTALVNLLLREIETAAGDADRQEASMKAIGKHAKDFLSAVRL